MARSGPTRGNGIDMADPSSELDALRRQTAVLEHTVSAYEERLSVYGRREALYRSIVEDGLGLICVHDLDGILFSINPAAADGLGYTPEDMIGNSVADYLDEEFRPFFPDYIARLRTNRVDEGLMRLRARDGTPQIWSYRNILMAGESPYILGHAQDVTALHRARAELRRTRDELEERVRERTSDLVEANRLLHEEIRKRRKAEEFLRRAKDRLELLSAIAIAASTCPTIDDIIQRTVERSSRFFPEDQVVFLHCVDSGMRVGPTALRGDASWTWRAGQTPPWPEPGRERLLRGDRFVDDGLAVCAYPVRRGDEVFGVFCLHALGPRAWSETDVEMVREIAGFLSLMVRAR